MEITDRNFQAFEQNETESVGSETYYDLVQQLGDYHATLGHYALAKEHYEQAASLEPDAASPYVGLGAIAMQNNLLDDADIAFCVACRLDPQCSKAYAGRAMVAQRQGDYRKAFDDYLKSLELDTDNFTALLGLFQTSCQMGSFAQIIHYLEVYLDMHPRDTSVQFSLAALYMKDGCLIKAQQSLRQLLTLDPSNQDAAHLLEEIEHSFARQEAVPLVSKDYDPDY